MNAECSLFEEVALMTTLSMQESLVGGSLELYAMEVKIVESPKNAIEDCCHY